jgi:hypothetical protein
LPEGQTIGFEIFAALILYFLYLNLNRRTLEDVGKFDRVASYYNVVASRLDYWLTHLLIYAPSTLPQVLEGNFVWAQVSNAPEMASAVVFAYARQKDGVGSDTDAQA